jgi:hypothetical protein
MTKETMLKSCPFCGGEARIETACNDSFFGPYCDSCMRVHFSMFDTAQQAITAWNTRSSDWISVEEIGTLIADVYQFLGAALGNDIIGYTTKDKTDLMDRCIEFLENLPQPKQEEG